MVGRCAVNKGACFLTFSLALLTILLFNNLTSSNSVDFANSNTDSSHTDMDSYGIVIDAGSTGSRLFLYTWTSHSVHQLVNIRAVNDHNGKPVVKKVTPGLSSFADHPEAAPDYIRPLLDFASRFIPDEKHPATPVFIFATAGMRLLPIEKQNQVMESLRKELPKLTKLQVLAQHVQVISGKWEGIYSWIAINYMLGRFNTTDNEQQTTGIGSSDAKEKESAIGEQRPKTAGMIDMGGASAQIAFEVPSEADDNSAAGDDKVTADGGQDDNNNVQTVNLGCRDEDRRFRYRLFVTTFLGFGVNEGAKRYETLLWKKLNNGNGSSTDGENGTATAVKYLPDGCLPVDMLKIAYVEKDSSQFVRKGNGDWDSCVADIASLLFDPDSKCPVSSPSCFFGGVQAPPRVSLSKVELYGFSEYWFSVEDVLSLGGKYEHDKFEQKAKQFCKQPWRTIKTKVRSGQYPKADSERLETQCFKSAWIHAVLHNGFHVDEVQHHFQSAFRINGQEVQWALGAIIYQMRYFPLLTESQKHSTDLNKLRQHFHGSATTNGWTVFYVLCIVAVLGMLLRMYQNSRQKIRLSTSKRNSAGQSLRYWRLNEQQDDRQLPI